MAITLDGTTGISSVDASASSPSVRGSDANTGVFYGADAIKFSTGGTQRAVIDNNGLSSAGHILQVVSMVTTTEDDITALTWTDTGLTLNITPTAVGNKILVLISQNVEWSRSAASSVGAIRAYRDSTLILNTGSATNMYGANATGATSTFIRTQINLNYLDTVPGSWSSGAINYHVEVIPTATSNSLQATVQKNNMPSTITLMEVAA